MSRSDDEDRQRWQGQARVVVDAVENIANAYVMTEGQDAAPEFAPRAYIDLPDEQRDTVIHALKEGEPSIVVRRSARGILIDPMTMQIGEEAIVAEKLLEVLT